MPDNEDLGFQPDEEEAKFNPDEFTDDEIRAMGGYTKGRILKLLFGDPDQKKLMTRISEREKKDKVVLDQIKKYTGKYNRIWGHRVVSPVFKKLKNTFGENPEFWDIVYSYENREHMFETLLECSEIYGDNFDLFVLIHSYLQKTGNGQHSLPRTSTFIEGLAHYKDLYGDDPEKLKTLMDPFLGFYVHSNSDEDFALLFGEDVKALCEGHLDRFGKFVSAFQSSGRKGLNFLIEFADVYKEDELILEQCLRILSPFRSTRLCETNLLGKILENKNLFVARKDLFSYFFKFYEKIMANGLNGHGHSEKSGTNLVALVDFISFFKEDPETLDYMFDFYEKNTTQDYKGLNGVNGTYSFETFLRLFIDVSKKFSNDTHRKENLIKFFEYCLKADIRIDFFVDFYNSLPTEIVSDDARLDFYLNHTFGRPNTYGYVRSEIQSFIEVENFFGKDSKEFNFFLNDPDQIRVLEECLRAFLSTPEIVKFYISLIASGHGDDAKALACFREMYTKNPDDIKFCYDLVCEDKNAAGIIASNYGENLIGKNTDKNWIKFCFDLVKTDPDAALILMGFYALAEKASFDKDLVKFYFDLIRENQEAGKVLINGYQRLIGIDREAARFYFDLIKEDKEAGRILADVWERSIEGNREKARYYFDLCKEDKKAARVLGQYGDLVLGDLKVSRFVFDLLKADRKDICDGLLEIRAFFQRDRKNDLNKLEISVKFLEISDQIDLKTLKNFYKIYQRDGEENAKKYIEGLVRKSKGLIGEKIPMDLRKDDEYLFYVTRVYPSGNYSNHERNLACGDRLEHLKAYKFNKEGYPAEMTGLLGYQLKEGQVENEDLLNNYKKRLAGIRDFVASRGPDNKALQKAFEEKIDSIFEKNVAEEFKQLKKLTLKEKLLILALNIIIKRARQEPYEYDVGDLIVEYKYAFHENLEAYIQRTSDETSRFKDPVSKNFNLWRELSVIYGENLKHVLRHDLFEEFERDSKHKADIENIFDSLMPGKEKFALNDKQKERFKTTLENPHIPEKGHIIKVKNKETGMEEEKYKPGKAEELYKQVYGIFSSNIKFKDDEEKAKFTEQVKMIVENCKEGELVNAEKFFSEAIPQLLRLRQRYLQNLNGKLEELFNADINLIGAEVSKYDEILEVEMKQTQMGGAKHKAVGKSAKKRKIRGYITKTKESANARMGAYLCISGDETMWKNPNYFELVMKDEESGKCIGVCMLMNIKAKDGKKYLWFGPNPFEGFLGQVSSDQCYRYMYDTITNFAAENGYDGVVVPPEDGQILGACTNRGGDFPDLIKASRLRDAKGALRIVEFGEPQKLGTHSGVSYSYSNGALIWANTSKSRKV
ncbi:MAG: hypothetical protein WC777_05075 [Candidatus Gracilibacteria bacterium]|jgi:hypothetical protein